MMAGAPGEGGLIPPLTTVVTEALLLLSVGSAVALPTVAVLVIEPAPAGVTVM